MTDKETREKQLLELIVDAENLATVHAKEYGETYEDLRESYLVLEEEVIEANKEIEEVVKKTGTCEFMSRLYFEEDYKKYVNDIKNNAQKGIVELLHVIAVCNKIEGMK